jgi:type VI secretion system secreted protein Hcp
MNPMVRLALGVATLAITTAAALPAHAECFLKLENVRGESTDAKHAGEIAISSWSWGLTQSAAHVGSGGGAGAADVLDLKVTKDIDHTTPTITKFAFSGAAMKSAVLSCRAPGKTADFIVIALSGTVFISSHKYGVERERPTEEVMLRFSSAQITHYIVTPHGAVEPVTTSLTAGR